MRQYHDWQTRGRITESVLLAMSIYFTEVRRKNKQHEDHDN